ncbi:MAG: zf-HC2 domain-containing protein, partial [Gemmatimonadaceae bacterium]|nr:zf-HC2 domain-containing protein [Gemmatimonadaceae bacterium]
AAHDASAVKRGESPARTAHGTMPGTPMLDCESVMRQLWDFLDGELTSDRMAAIRAHLALCKRCYPQYQFEESFLAAVAARRRHHSDPQRLRARVADALEAQGLSDA